MCLTRLAGRHSLILVCYAEVQALILTGAGSEPGERNCSVKGARGWD
jgi:hypothetical protein